VSPAALYNRIDTAKNAGQSVYGRGDQTLLNLAQAGKRVLSDTKTPNSGTARRLGGLFGESGVGSVLGGLVPTTDSSGHTSHFDPAHMAMGAAGAVALPMVLRAAVENPFLVNKIMGWNNSPTLGALMRGTGKVTQAAGTQLGAGVAQPASAPR
jgi:hypothetical protein